MNLGFRECEEACIEGGDIIVEEEATACDARVAAFMGTPEGGGFEPVRGDLAPCGCGIL